MFIGYFGVMKANPNTPTAGLRMRRIQKVSKIIRAYFLAALVFECIVMSVGAIALPLIMVHWSTLKSQATFNNCCVLMTLPFAFMVTLNFFRLFSRLKDGQLFEGQTIKYLEKAGKWWIVLAVIQALFEFLQCYIYTPTHIVVTGHGIFGGLVIFFIAWVLQEAQELKEEQELTV